MIYELYHYTPNWVKMVCDVATGGIGAAAIMGHLTTFFGLVAAASAAVYGVLRLYYYVRDRRED